MMLPQRNISRQHEGDPLLVSTWQAEKFLRDWDQADRYEKAASIHCVDPKFNDALDRIQDDLEHDLYNYSMRRQIENQLADRIESFGFGELGRRDLCRIVESLRSCRNKAAIGIQPNGKKMLAWDNKCSLSRLCPDEARAETQRLCEKYIPAMVAWANDKPNRRLYYAVLTSDNVNPGQLLKGKHRQFDDFKALMKSDYCKQRVKGALVVQEDPLSAHNDWNVHLNAILCVEGEFSYKRLRELWGFNLQIDKLSTSIEKLTRTLLELVKYSARHTGIKSTEKFDSGETSAPPMLQWSAESWLEWWDAQRPQSASGKTTAFRRTRSYGCLYKVNFDPPKVDMSLVEWIGSLEYIDGAYRMHMRNKAVDLIMEDNFSGSEPRTDNLRGFYNETGPPDNQLGGYL